MGPSILDVIMSLSLMVIAPDMNCCGKPCFTNTNTINEEFDMKFKKGNRWKSSKSEVRYKVWRKNVFELNRAKLGLRRYYICEKCDKRRKTTRVLHAHHIKSWNKFPKDRYDRSNGVVLCIPCHNKFHRTYKFEALDKPELLWEYLGKKH